MKTSSDNILTQMSYLPNALVAAAIAAQNGTGSVDWERTIEGFLFGHIHDGPHRLGIGMPKSNAKIKTTPTETLETYAATQGGKTLECFVSKMKTGKDTKYVLRVKYPTADPQGKAVFKDFRITCDPSDKKTPPIVEWKDDSRQQKYRRVAVKPYPTPQPHTKPTNPAAQVVNNNTTYNNSNNTYNTTNIFLNGQPQKPKKQKKQKVKKPHGSFWQGVKNTAKKVVITFLAIAAIGTPLLAAHNHMAINDIKTDKTHQAGQLNPDGGDNGSTTEEDKKYDDSAVEDSHVKPGATDTDISGEDVTEEEDTTSKENFTGVTPGTNPDLTGGQTGVYDANGVKPNDKTTEKSSTVISSGKDFTIYETESGEIIVEVKDNGKGSSTGLPNTGTFDTVVDAQQDALEDSTGSYDAKGPEQGK